MTVKALGLNHLLMKSHRHQPVKILAKSGSIPDASTSLRHSGFSFDTSVTVWPQDTEGQRRTTSPSVEHWKPIARRRTESRSPALASYLGIFALRALPSPKEPSFAEPVR